MGMGKGAGVGCLERGGRREDLRETMYCIVSGMIMADIRDCRVGVKGSP